MLHRLTAVLGTGLLLFTTAVLRASDGVSSGIGFANQSAVLQTAVQETRPVNKSVALTDDNTAVSQTFGILKENASAVSQNTSQNVMPILQAAAQHIGEKINAANQVFDINKDQVINIKDLLAIANDPSRFTSQIGQVYTTLLTAAQQIGKTVTSQNQRFDVNNDNKINVLDLLAIAKPLDLMKGSKSDRISVLLAAAENIGKTVNVANEIFDVNKDNKINILDILTIGKNPSAVTSQSTRVLSTLSKASQNIGATINAGNKKFDVNNDGKINILDVLTIARNIDYMK